MDVLKIRWTQRLRRIVPALRGILPALSSRFDRALRRLGWRRSQDEQVGPILQPRPGPDMFWHILGSIATVSNEGTTISVARLAPVLRRCYPELRTPDAWINTFRRWLAEETDPWRQAVLGAVFPQLWNRSAFHGPFPAIEVPNRADRLQVEGAEEQTQVQDGLPVEMEIDQYW